MKAILMVSHGSRDVEAVKIMDGIAEELGRVTGYRVVSCYMQFNSPNIEESVNFLYKQGFKDVIVIPYFLFSGLHVKVDIPEVLSLLKERYRDMKFRYLDPIGYHPLIIQILKEKIEEDLKCI